jgi:hypothetical protein
MDDDPMCALPGLARYIEIIGAEEGEDPLELFLECGKMM